MFSPLSTTREPSCGLDKAPCWGWRWASDENLCSTTGDSFRDQKFWTVCRLIIVTVFITILTWNLMVSAVEGEKKRKLLKNFRYIAYVRIPRFLPEMPFLFLGRCFWHLCYSIWNTVYTHICIYICAAIYIYIYIYIFDVTSESI